MRRLAGLATLLVLVGLLGAAQLVLPGLAADHLRDQLARDGRVLGVEVSAFPAIELLWHRADRVVIRMADYRASGTQLSSAVGQVADTDSLDASAVTVTAGLLNLHDARLRKRGDALSGSAEVDEADLRRAIPFLDSVQAVPGPVGTLTLQGTASLLGVSATAQATVAASGGRILLTPRVPFGALATLTLFANPKLRIDAVAAQPSVAGFAVEVRAHVG